MKSKTIQQVKAEWEKRLMAMPGVTGVGISMTKDHTSKCIQVTVRSKASEKAADIPIIIDGFPVEVKIRDYRAL